MLDTSLYFINPSLLAKRGVSQKIMDTLSHLALSAVALSLLFTVLHIVFHLLAKPPSHLTFHSSGRKPAISSWKQWKIQFILMSAMFCFERAIEYYELKAIFQHKCPNMYIKKNSKINDEKTFSVRLRFRLYFPLNPSLLVWSITLS